MSGCAIEVYIQHSQDIALTPGVVSLNVIVIFFNWLFLCDYVCMCCTDVLNDHLHPHQQMIMSNGKLVGAGFGI